MQEQLDDKQIAKLAKGWRRGDKDSFSKLYDHFIDNIFRFIYFKVNNNDAEDLTELTFIKAWERRKKYDPAKGAFSSWLYTIARNTVIDHYRVSKEVYELDYNTTDDSRRSDPKGLVEESLNADKLRKAINKLPENYRDILLLRFIEDMDYAEVAEYLGKSEGAVRITQFRAIKELRKVLDKMGFKL